MTLYRFIPVLFLLLFSGCFEEKEIFLPNTNVDDPAYLYRQNIISPVQYQIPVSDEDFILTTKSKSIFRIPAGSLLHENGNVFRGVATIEIIETPSLGDHILLGKNPVAQGQLLTSQRLLHIQFFDGSQKLIINQSKPVEWITHIQHSEDFQFLYKEVTSESNMNTWVSQTNLALKNWTVVDQNQTFEGTGCIAPVEDNGWYLLATPHQINQQLSHEICLEVEEGFHPGNSVLFLVSGTGKTFAPMGVNEERSEFCSAPYEFMENSGIKFVLIAYREDGQHYFAQIDIMAGHDHIAKIEPKVLSLEEIVSKLRHL